MEQRTYCSGTTWNGGEKHIGGTSRKGSESKVVHQGKAAKDTSQSRAPIATQRNQIDDN